MRFQHLPDQLVNRFKESLAGASGILFLHQEGQVSWAKTNTTCSRPRCCWCTYTLAKGSASASLIYPVKVGRCDRALQFASPMQFARRHLRSHRGAVREVRSCVGLDRLDGRDCVERREFIDGWAGLHENSSLAALWPAGTLSFQASYSHKVIYLVLPGGELVRHNEQTQRAGPDKLQLRPSRRGRAGVLKPY
uniref:B1306.03 protein n=1 Tax=Mycobacterium leprae TaxID=1769 RepID=O07135_MYCLR|nr:B1306.03 protein [Mycobacterium leprae]